MKRSSNVVAAHTARCGSTPTSGLVSRSNSAPPRKPTGRSVPNWVMSISTGGGGFDVGIERRGRRGGGRSGRQRHRRVFDLRCVSLLGLGAEEEHQSDGEDEDAGEDRGGADPVGEHHGVLATIGLVADPEQVPVVGPDQQGRHDHQGRQQRDRHVERDDHPEIGEQREGREDEDAEPADRRERRGEERPSGAGRRSVGGLVGSEAALSLLEVSAEDQHAELRTGRDHQRSAHGREWAEGEAEHGHDHRRGADGEQHGNHGEQGSSGALRNRARIHKPAVASAR